jgi:hypothetical protein
MACACGRTPDPGICPIAHDGRPAGGHCACAHPIADRASIHRAAVEQIRVIARGLYFETGARVLAALDDGPAS